MSSPETPGTWRTSDGERVLFPDALQAWADHGHPYLRALARTYGSWVTYEDFAEELQAGTGIRTKMMLPNWIGKALGQVGLQARDCGEPLITSLVVHKDGTIGPGYAEVYRQRGLPVPEDLDQAAANDRLACCRFFGADIPAGAVPTLTPQVAASRQRRRQRSARPARATCPTCFRELPFSGICDICEDT
jgi:hypothetical protein